MLGCFLASPTVVLLGGEPRLVARLRLGDFGLLLSEGAIALGCDPDSREGPEWGDDGFYDWLTGEGIGLFLWCVLRRDRPGLTLAECERIAVNAETAEIATAYRAAMRRSTTEIAGKGAKADVAKLRWGRTIKLLRAGHGYPAIAELTLDQIDLEGAKADDADPEADAEERALLDDMQRQHESIHGGGKTAAPAVPDIDPATLPKGVTPEVAADVLAMGLSFAPESPDEPR